MSIVKETYVIFFFYLQFRLYFINKIIFIFIWIIKCESFGYEYEFLRDCQYIPDVFFFCVILYLGTFLLAMSLRSFKFSNFLPDFVSCFIFFKISNDQIYEYLTLRFESNWVILQLLQPLPSWSQLIILLALIHPNCTCLMNFMYISLPIPSL